MMHDTLLDLRVWWPPLLAALGGLLLGMLVRRTLVTWVARLARKTAWKYDDVLIESIRGPVVLWFVLLGLRLAVRMLPLSDTTDHTLGQVILVLGILSVSWALANFASRLLRVGATHHLPNVSLIATLVRIVVFIVGLLMIFDALGIAIGPVLTAVGVGGLAVGLALQDTLSNFFAGMRVIAARKIRSGDLIKLETGQEGFVEDINWGLTTLREGAGNLIIVPNAKLASAIVINYHLPSAPQNVNVEFGVSYQADLDQVEKVTLEVALATQHEVKEATTEFVPAFRYKEFADSAVRCFVVLQAQSQQDRYAVVSGFMKRLRKRFREDGIEFPMPARLMITRESKASPG